jgi:peptide/nickel transport system permease protein
MAYKEGSRLDQGLTGFTILNRSIPYYVVAILSLILFGFVLGWLPTAGRATPGTTPGMNLPFVAGVVEHAALPVLSTLVAGFGGALAFRGNCIRELGEGYIRVARLRGISDARIAIRYVGRNAILPVYTNLMLGIAGVFGSGIIIETIFSYPAVGYATFNALTNRDYPLLMGTFIFFTTITVVGILIADLTYGIVDPRVSGGGDRESY